MLAIDNGGGEAHKVLELDQACLFKLHHPFPYESPHFPASGQNLQK